MADDASVEERQTNQSHGMGKVPKVVLWVVGILVGVSLLLYIATFFLDEPLRRYVENRANKKLQGYSVRLSGLRVQLLGGGFTLKGLTVLQEAHPDPPVASIASATASISWRDIIHGKLVAFFQVDNPKLHINLPQLKSEVASKKEGKSHGWQQAIEAVYPLKLNRLVINNASITYVDKDPNRPLHLGHLNVRAENIRNVKVGDRVYPSSLHVDTDIFHSGHGSFDGRANFLAEPVAAVKGEFKFQKIPLDYFKPILDRYNLEIRNGMLSLSGNMEYGPKFGAVRIEDLVLRGLEMDYVHSKATKAAEKKRAKKAGKAAKGVSNKPEVQLRVDKFSLVDGNVGVVNKDASNPYRIFISKTDLTITNLSNHLSEGPAKAELTGKFMGSGTTKATGVFRPEHNGPDLDLRVRIEDTQLKSMNDIFRSYGKFDVSKGVFLFYTDLRVRNNRIDGYIKPLFKDIKVYDKRKDKDKSAFKKLYEMLVGGVASLLENRPRSEMATKADISGPLKNPQLSTLQVIVQLVKNAFFKAILPGFEREVTAQKK